MSRHTAQETEGKKRKTPNRIVFSQLALVISFLIPFITYVLRPDGAPLFDLAVVYLVITFVAGLAFVNPAGYMLWILICVEASLWPLVLHTLPDALPDVLTDRSMLLDFIAQFGINLAMSITVSACFGFIGRGIIAIANMINDLWD